MNHYVYEITNLINGKKYIGKRSCHCDISKDRYMGSGYALKEAINKYGINNFKKEIIFICKTDDEAYKKEAYYIQIKNATNDKMYYNLCGGGRGVGSGENNPRYGKKLTEEHKKILLMSNVNRVVPEETRKKMSNYWKGRRIGEKNTFYGKKHTEESKMKMKIKASNRILSEDTKIKISEALKGEKSPMYGVPKTDDIKRKIGESRKGKLVGGENPWSKKVLCVTTNEVFESMSDASRKYNVDVSNITACCKGRRKTAGGLKWAYTD